MSSISARFNKIRTMLYIYILFGNDYFKIRINDIFSLKLASLHRSAGRNLLLLNHRHLLYVTWYQLLSYLCNYLISNS